MNNINHVLYLFLKMCQNPNPGDAQLRNISLAIRYLPHQSKKLDTVFNI